MFEEEFREADLDAQRNSRQSAKGPHIRSVARSVRILRLFSVESPELTLSEITRRTGIPRATTYRMVRTLEDEHCLFFNAGTSRYHLGPGMIPALYALRDHSHLVRLLHDDLQELAETAGEHASLAKEVDQTAVIIDSVASSRNPFQLLIPIGRVHEGLAGAHCKVIAAFKKKEELAALLAVPQTAWTANTITDSEVLAAELEVVAREGIAFDLAEYYPAVYAVSAPVRDRSGSVVASVGLAAPAYAFEGEGRQWLADTLKTFAAKMSRKLGYSQGYSE